MDFSLHNVRRVRRAAFFSSLACGRRRNKKKKKERNKGRERWKRLNFYVNCGRVLPLLQVLPSTNHYLEAGRFDFRKAQSNYFYYFFFQIETFWLPMLFEANFDKADESFLITVRLINCKIDLNCSSVMSILICSLGFSTKINFFFTNYCWICKNCTSLVR